MRGSTHILGGLTLASITTITTGLFFPQQVSELSSATIEYSTTGLWLLGASIGAILPDIDHKNSKISNQHKAVSFFSRLFLTHRGFTHSLLALFILSAVVYPISILIPSSISVAMALGIILGYFSHLLLDCFNPTGIPIFYPFSFRLHLAKVKTGGLIEWIIKIILLLLFLVCMKQMWGEIIHLKFIKF